MMLSQIYELKLPKSFLANFFFPFSSLKPPRWIFKIKITQEWRDEAFYGLSEVGEADKGLGFEPLFTLNSG